MDTKLGLFNDARQYFLQSISDPGMKVLLLDDQTVLFLGVVRPHDLEGLAESDAKEKVVHVYEHYYAFHTITPKMYSSIPPQPKAPSFDLASAFTFATHTWSKHAIPLLLMERGITEEYNHIISSFLCQMLKPTSIRFLGKSLICKQLAQNVAQSS
ncbi:MAG: hypothetical protein EZS28_045153 [Streblomastix strix]|uniref:Uncharacterized protein n=1 Tax=Streblomastix strix TaxID=222440 RepID=A0A5J4TNA6_9EUKA|nr:MAG: hypothetical protein EZS28_045153 [Streblomastix strix]